MHVRARPLHSESPVALAELNSRDESGFVSVCGPLFEGSPWIAARTWERRPFSSLDALLRELTATVERASEEEKVGLISAHPDLVGRLAREGRLTRESSHEQAAAGLDSLSEGEAASLDRFNREYREKFGFPFVICARENRKEAILDAFPRRLLHSREQEIAAALAEIGKIARLRLLDRVAEG
jgi:2-oxo-4-hydroxy-4-carboxy-5-ureidoimidazoline decarboxylase